MPDEGAGNQGGQQGGGAGSQAGSATVDWSKGGAEHFGSFKESLGDLGKDKSLEPIKDFHGLGKSYIEGQKMIGRGIFLPKDGIPEEERKKSVDGIMDKLRKANIIEGVPASPEGYQIRMPEKMLNGEPFSPNEPLLNSFRQAIHKLGLPPSKAQGLFDWYLNFQAESEASEEKAFAEMKVNLKKEWGGFYIRNMEAARRAVFKYVGEDGDSIISSLPPEIGQKLVRAFSQIGEPLLEDDIVTGNLQGMPNSDEIWKKMIEMQNQPASDLSHIGHKIWLKEYESLSNQYNQLQSRKR